MLTLYVLDFVLDLARSGELYTYVRRVRRENLTPFFYVLKLIYHLL